ncbi:unnamed protein product [Natator depressus]
MKELGVQVLFSSILLVKGRGPSRDRCILEVNAWLQGWCHQEGFSFLDHGMLFQEEGLLSRDGVHRLRKGKSIFGYRLANLVRRFKLGSTGADDHSPQFWPSKHNEHTSTTPRYK